MAIRGRGLHIRTDGQGREIKIRTLTCGHCQRVVPETEKLPNGDWAKGFCHHCMREVCVRCGARQTCDHFEKQLKRIEARAELLRSMGLS